MSYILDALRKSEQERLRGKLPDLNHFGEEDKQSTSPHRGLWVFAGALLLVNLAAVGIWITRTDQPPVMVAAETAATSPADTAATVEMAPSKTAAVAPVTQPTPQAVAAQPANTGIEAPVNQVTSPAQAAIPAGAVPQGALTGVPVNAVGAAPAGTVYYVTPGTAVPGQQIVVVPAGGVMPGAVAPTGNVVVQVPPQAVNAWPSQPTVVQPPPPVPPPPVPVNLDQALDATGTNAALPSVSYLPQLHELPEYLRSQIPDMTFSSHMYSSMPRFRSVVINGTRVKEGQAVGNNIQVNEITETGVILSVGGTLFQVDVLGKWSQ